MLPSTNRLKKSLDFDRAFKKGKHLKGKFGKLVVFNRRDNESPRVGVVVPGKLGDACKRNKAKRQVRQVFHDVLSDLVAGSDYIYIAWNIEFKFDEIEKDLQALLKEG